MWQGPRKSRQKCAMDDLSPQQQQHCLDILHQNPDVQATIATTPTTTTRACGHDFIPLTILPHVRRAHLQFPPPPNYPPPHHPSTSKMSSSPLPQSEEHPLGGNNCMPGPSTQQQQQQTWEMPTDYSYAYYVPGPPTRHTNVPSKYPGTYREGSYRSRHTYLTRYGTEENIYEEISEFERARLRPQHHHYHHHHHHHNLHQDSVMSINQSLVEEEVRRIQSGHRRVLGELNLSVEAMLMPQSSSSSREGSEDTDRENETDDQLADLLTIGPTDDLLSPVPLVDLDSGFSGSSSGASYRSSTTSSLRRCTGTSCAVSSVSSGASGVQERPKSTISLMKTPPQNITLTTTPSGSKGFWGKKAWKKLTGFPSTISLNKQKDEPRIRSGNWEEATICDRLTTTPPTATASTTPHSRTLQHTISQRSSEGSWCSGSEPELSSDDESDKSAASSTRSNGQLRNTLNKARTLCDKLRNSGGLGGGSHRLSLDGSLPGDAPSPQIQSNQGRLSRWFSIRRGSTHQYDIENVDGNTRSPQHSSKMPQLPEVDEETTVFPNCTPQQRRQLPPSLPPPPPDLTPQQLKRRMIVQAIVHSENSYVATLQRLVNDYKKPLEESSPAILSSSKIATLFYRLPEILQCHTLFRIALAESVRNWDRDERIGDVFVASFSKAIVLDIYSGFINNFSVAMDLAKMESKRKSALADFFKVKQISSNDRLSFFGLMVKPVQRFPQFILFLQDLLKHTPQGHHDRMSLQLALTQLESLAEMLNERKREAEQYQAFKEMLRHISGKFSARPLSDCNRYLLREDNVIQLEYNQNGMITKAKNRRLLLLNDLIVCVSVAPKSTDDFGSGSSERLSLKWTYPVADVEIQDTSTSPTLSRILTATNKGGSVKSNGSFDAGHPSPSHQQQQQPPDANNLCTEMSNLMHDYEIMSRVSDLIGQLKGDYKDFNSDNTRRVLQQIQTSIQQKDEEMAWLDSCCLQLVVKAKGKEEVFTFKTDNPSIKREWITELRLAQLALDPNNSPAWEVPEQEQRPSTKMPLFVRSQCVYKSQHQTEVRCGCYYTVTTPKPTRRRHRTQNYLWICTSDGASSHITVLSQHQQHNGVLKEITTFSLVETQITTMEFVKGAPPPCPSLASDTVWMGTDSHRLLLYAADEPEKQEQLTSVTVSDMIMQIKYHCDNVFVALANGNLIIYKRNLIDGSWLLYEPRCIELGSNDPVSCLLPINQCLYAACGKKVWVLNGCNGEIQKHFSIQHEHVGNVNLMAHSGIGLWISLKHSSTICLYHTETFKHLQDINIASNVMRITTPTNGSRDCVNNNRSQVNVTALLACKGLLWVGTNVGIALTIPLPRLEGVPIISGRVNISYHAHFGPISFLLALQPKNYNNYKNSTNNTNNNKIEVEDNTVVNSSNGEKIEERPKIEKQPETSSPSSKLRYLATSSPIVIRRRRSKDCDMVRLSKTLPRCFGINNNQHHHHQQQNPTNGSIFSTTSSTSSHSDTCDVYGLYGELMYIKDYDGDTNLSTDPIYESLRRSDPELAAIPNKVCTLDRRLKMKVSRPRSLDLSNWSVDSRSSSLCTSSGSEESMAIRNNSNIGRSVSRNNSNASRQLNDVCENSVCNNIKGNNSNVIDNKQANLTINNKTLNSVIDNTGGNNGRRTILTLMGGRGYVNFRQPCCPADKNKTSFSIRESNRNDAHIVIWELKL